MTDDKETNENERNISLSGNRHENYEILNLLGYGLAKFDSSFSTEFGFDSKSAFYDFLVKTKVAETTGTVKNRQDLFDPFFQNGRKGWWQKGDAYVHRKILIDSLFGGLGCREYAQIVKLYLKENYAIQIPTESITPVQKSRFKQMQLTGLEAELFFLHNFQQVVQFAHGTIEDARLYGDGYDFQVSVQERCYLAEVKGVRAMSGSIRLTELEFSQATDYQADYGIVVISNLENVPKMTTIFDPINNLNLKETLIAQSQKTYHSDYISW